MDLNWLQGYYSGYMQKQAQTAQIDYGLSPEVPEPGPKPFVFGTQTAPALSSSTGEIDRIRQETRQTLDQQQAEADAYTKSQAYRNLGPAEQTQALTAFLRKQPSVVSQYHRNIGRPDLAAKNEQLIASRRSNEEAAGNTALASSNAWMAERGISPEQRQEQARQYAAYMNKPHGNVRPEEGPRSGLIARTDPLEQVPAVSTASTNAYAGRYGTVSGGPNKMSMAAMKSVQPAAVAAAPKAKQPGNEQAMLDYIRNSGANKGRHVASGNTITHPETPKTEVAAQPAQGDNI